MEPFLKSAALLLSILLTGLTAGLCFTWSNAVTPGIGRLDDLSFLQSFQAMNRAILNPTFLFVFFGPVPLLFWNAYSFRQAAPATSWAFLWAALLYFVGLAMVTIFKNVPLNELLDRVSLERLTEPELKSIRDTFEKPWNRWHLLRTLTSLGAFFLMLLGTYNLKG